MRQHSLCTDELRVEVGLDNALPEIERHLLYQFVATNAGVIDQNIDASGCVVQASDCKLYIVL